MGKGNIVYMSNYREQIVSQPKHKDCCISWRITGIIAYLITLLITPIAYFVLFSLGCFPAWLVGINLAIQCALFGLVGGCTYCLRAVYYNKCVTNTWDNKWVVWYFLRPIVSTVIGVITFFLLATGLIAIGGNGVAHSKYLFYIMAFFAGLKVDFFLKKVEGQLNTK